MSREVLRPAAVTAMIEGILAELGPRTRAQDLTRRRHDHTALDAEIENLTGAIATGGRLTPLLTALRTRQERRVVLAAEIAAQTAVDVKRFDRRKIDQTVQRRFEEWRAQLAGSVQETRQLLREILVTPLILMPRGRAYRFKGGDGGPLAFGPNRPIN